MPLDLRDREVFAGIYQAHHAAVFRFVLGMTGDRVKAAEVTQDVFVWLIDHTASYDPARGELVPFLLGVARKLLLRRNRVERGWVELTEAELTRSPATGELEDLRCAIAALPVRYREVVVLCDLEGLSYEETAASLDCAVGTVRSRLHRARHFLQRKLRPAKNERCPA